LTWDHPVQKKQLDWIAGNPSIKKAPELTEAETWSETSV
jgi:hypothetical protein